MKIICSGKHTVGQADSRLYGHFLEHFHRQIYGGVFDPSSPFADDGQFTVGGYYTKLREARLLPGGEALPFEQDKARITVKGLPAKSPDPVCNVGVVELLFEEEPRQDRGSIFPQLHWGDRLL